ncbi:hypothetical protein OIE71_29300 [Streptomyces sp. NBC_01725]|uniref:hypothetical protein n=1 Tax=Streptomyces sp. NBC_01725 TaxID=2975923 RepID=UPI002E2BD9C7|nr:hypothetical protein [Streptomyces sp. NBC_01725]
MGTSLTLSTGVVTVTEPTGSSGTGTLGLDIVQDPDIVITDTTICTTQPVSPGTSLFCHPGDPATARSPL